jgi:hypothetical protein
MKKENKHYKNKMKKENNLYKIILGGIIFIILGVIIYFSLIQPKMSGFVISNEIEEQEDEDNQFDNREDSYEDYKEEKDDEEKEKDDEEKEKDDEEKEKDDEKDDKNDDKENLSLEEILLQEGYDVTYLETEGNAGEIFFDFPYNSVLVSIKNETILSPIIENPKGGENMFEESQNLCENILPYIKEAYSDSEVWMIVIHNGIPEELAILCTFSIPELNLGGCTCTSVPPEYYG